MSQDKPCGLGYTHSLIPTLHNGSDSERKNGDLQRLGLFTETFAELAFEGQSLLVRQIRDALPSKAIFGESAGLRFKLAPAYHKSLFRAALAFPKVSSRCPRL